jgi:hypothetical protein
MRRASLAAGFLALLLPTAGAVFAAGALEVSDSVAGLSLGIDLYGLTPNTGYTVEIAGPNGTRTVAAATDTQGSGEAVVRGEDLVRAGNYAATLLQGGQSTGTQSAFTIYPDEPSMSVSQLAGDRTAIDADGSDSLAVAARLTDRYGNGIADRPLALVPSRNSDSVTKIDSQTDSEGWQRFYVTATQAGQMTLRATDLVSGRTLDDVLTVSVGGGAVGGDDDPVFTAQLTPPVPSVVDTFEVLLPSTLAAGIEAQTFTVRAVDKNGTVVPSYVSKIRFRSSDPLAELPGLDDTYQFVAKDQGAKTFALALKLSTPGTQTVTVEDSEDGSIRGTATVTVTGQGPSGGGTITIDSPAQGSAVGGGSVTLIGKGPVLANIVSSGGLAIARGATGEDGSFALTVPIGTTPDIAISISDDTGRFRSPTLRLKLDADAPKIDLITFTPERPVAGQEVTASLKTAATDVAKAQIKLTDSKNAAQTLALTPMGSALFQAKFTASLAGTYQVSGAAVDLVGNTGSLVSTLAIRPAAPANVRVAPKGQLMEVTWTASPSTVDGYRIYIGEKEGEWDYALDTRQSEAPLTTTASVKDLEPGKPYSFAVSAVVGDLESDLSATARQTSLGLGLTIQPGDGALILRWNALPAAIPVTNYRLRFGLRPDALTEQRTLPAVNASNSYVIADLINGLTYYVELMPVAGGNPIVELGAAGQGTPNGDGNPLPGTDVGHGGAPLPPVTTGSGPAGWVWGALAAAGLVAGAMQWSYRRRSRLLLP